MCKEGGRHIDSSDSGFSANRRSDSSGGMGAAGAVTAVAAFRSSRHAGSLQGPACESALISVTLPERRSRGGVQGGWKACLDLR